MFKVLLFLLGVNVSGMVLNPLNMKNFDWITNQFNTPSAKIINPINDEPVNRSIVFFPATTVNRIPVEMYNDFLYSLAEKNMEIYIPKNNALDGVIDDLKDRNMEITLVAHSTAAVDAIRSCQSTDIVDNLILIDPLDTRGVNKNEDTNPLFLNTIDKLLILNSEKSNDWKLVPIVMPIGVFSLDTNSIRVSNNVVKEVAQSDTFGHFDILDNTWANIIHNTISKGSEDRNPLKLHKYRQWVADKIDTITDNDNTEKAIETESFVSKEYWSPKY